MWTETGSSNANAEVTVSHAAEAGRRHYVSKLTVSIRGATSGNDIRVEIRDGDDNVKWDTYINAARGLALQENFDDPIEIDTNKAAKAVVAAAGASAIATVSFGGYSK